MFEGSNAESLEVFKQRSDGMLIFSRVRSHYLPCRGELREVKDKTGRTGRDYYRGSLICVKSVAFYPLDPMHLIPFYSYYLFDFHVCLHCLDLSQFNYFSCFFFIS